MQNRFINIAIIICNILVFEELLISKALAGGVSKIHIESLEALALLLSMTDFN